MRAAADDLCWLAGRGYSRKTALRLVGDRYGLRDRQRRALQRSAASIEECEHRIRSRVEPAVLAGEELVVDGYNVLLTLEAALSGGVLLLGRDGVLRDLAAMSAHYRRVQATRPALELLAAYFRRTGVTRVLWCLDRPVANSGRLKRLIEETVQGIEPEWTVELTDRTDALLAESGCIVASADSAILDRCDRWVNLARILVEASIADAWIVDFGQGSQTPDC